eukprot:5117100-Amphidinium_carterae.1
MYTSPTQKCFVDNPQQFTQIRNALLRVVDEQHFCYISLTWLQLSVPHFTSFATLAHTSRHCCSREATSEPRWTPRPHTYKVGFGAYSPNRNDYIT